jgi:hypothetical protein
MNEHERRPDPGLDERLAALPRELPPARDLWPAIEAAITPVALRGRRWPYALAAGIAIAALGALVAGRMARESVVVTAGGPAARPGATQVVARLKGTEDAEYQATRTALERTYRERLALLAPDTRKRIEQDLALIRSAHDDIQQALTRDPDSRVLLELLQSTTEQEFNLYSTVGRTTAPLAPRTTT